MTLDRFPCCLPSAGRRREALPAVCLLAVLSVAIPLAAAEPVALDRALELALAGNPELLAARQELTIARGRIVRARYWNPFNPEVGAGAAQRRFEVGGSAVEPSGQVSLEIEIGGQRGKRIEEAEKNLARVEAEVADVERRITSEVEESFYRVLYLHERSNLFGEVAKLNGRLRAASAERFAAGEAPKLEANLAAVRAARSQRDRLAAERDERNARRALERVLGVEPVGAIRIVGDLAVHATAMSADELVKTALGTRPDLRARAEEIRRIDAETSLTRRSIIPNPTISGGYDEDSLDTGGQDRIVGGAVTFPIPLFDRKQAELVALGGERSRALDEEKSTALTVETEVRDAVRSYDTARAAVTLLETDAVSRIDESFGLIETAYREGKIDLLRLVTAENDLVDARISYLETVWEFWSARVALAKAIGAPLEEATKP